MVRLAKPFACFASRAAARRRATLDGDHRASERSRRERVGADVRTDVEHAISPTEKIGDEMDRLLVEAVLRQHPLRDRVCRAGLDREGDTDAVSDEHSRNEHCRASVGVDGGRVFRHLLPLRSSHLCQSCDRNGEPLDTRQRRAHECRSA